MKQSLLIFMSFMVTLSLQGGQVEPAELKAPSGLHHKSIDNYRPAPYTSPNALESVALL